MANRILLAGVVIIGLGACIWLSGILRSNDAEMHAYGSPYGLLDLQRAWSADNAQTILNSWRDPKQAKLFDVARSSIDVDFAFLVAYGVTLAGLALLVRGSLRNLGDSPSPWAWSNKFAEILEKLSCPAIVSPLIAASFDVIENVLHRRVLSQPEPSAGTLTSVASVFAYLKFALLISVVLYLTLAALYLLARNRSPRWAKFLEVLRVTRFSFLAVVIVGSALSLAPQMRDALRVMAEHGTGQTLLAEMFLVGWALTVWYTARFLLNVDFGTKVFGLSAIDPAAYLTGETNWPRFLGASAFFSVAIAMFVSWWEVWDFPKPEYRSLLYWSLVNLLLGLFFGWVAQQRRRLLAQWNATSWKGQPFRAAPRSVKYLVAGSLILTLIMWLLVFFFLQSVAPRVGSITLLLGASISVTMAGSLLVWLGERAKLPAISIILLVAVIFSYTNDNHGVRKLDGPLRDVQRIEINEHFQNWFNWVSSKYSQTNEHPLFIVSAAGGGIRAAYWTASVLAKIQDQNPAFADHALFVSGISGGSLGALVFANLVTTTDHGKNWRVPRNELDESYGTGVCRYEDDTPGKYQVLSQRILSWDFLAPTAASLLYGDFLARFLPFPLLSDRAEALETAWERAWDTTQKEEQALGRFSAVWQKNPFTRSFEDLYDFETIKPERAPRSGQIPILLINGTLVESGKRILTSHIEHPPSFKGDIENTFDHRRAPMRMSTVALMSARFTYVSPPGTLAPQSHVVDGGYFENSGATTALQVWAEIEEQVSEFNKKNKAHQIRPVYIQIDNDPPPSKEEQQRIERRKTVPTNREEYPNQYPRPLPEVRAPINALLATRNAHAVEVFNRAEQAFGEDFVHFDTNHEDKTLEGLVSAPLGWVLSTTARKALDRQLCHQGKAMKTILKVLPKM